MTARIAFVIALSFCAATTQAQSNYPTKPVRLIVPFPPGQATDIFARMLGERLGAMWNQQVVIDNRGGGGGVPGTSAIKDAAPDGYTLGMGSSGTLAINAAVYSKLAYAPLRDFTAVNHLFLVPLVVIANPNFPAKTLADLVAEAQRKPGAVMYGSGGPGTSQHLTAELFRSRANIDVTHVPYKGSGPALTDLLGGQIPWMVDSVTAASGHIKSGKVRALAVTSSARVPALPDVPTIAESGYPGFEGVGWAGVVGPAGIPRDIVERVSADIRKVLAEPSFRERMIERGGVPDARDATEFGAFIKSEIEKWTQVARAAGVKLD
jgi:tripartite-type tricarboxylate transporter receptor subunit TctC